MPASAWSATGSGRVACCAGYTSGVACGASETGTREGAATGPSGGTGLAWRRENPVCERVDLAGADGQDGGPDGAPPGPGVLAAAGGPAGAWVRARAQASGTTAGPEASPLGADAAAGRGAAGR
ncbi:MAG TPA: hypothetical protein VGG75_28650 [Trebonia sp.]